MSARNQNQIASLPPRHARYAVNGAVDAHHSDFEPCRDREGSASIARPNRGSQAVGAVVGEPHAFVRVPNASDREHGAKCLLAHETQVVRHVHNHGRFQEEAGARNRPASNDHARAPLPRLFEP